MVRHLNLPKEGWSEEAVRNEVDKLAGMDHTRWEDGFVSGAVYHGGESLIKLQTEAYGRFTVANPIHPDVFPGVRKMEAEIVAMVLAMFNAPAGAAGVTTGGGTESILMACLSARQKAYIERGVTEPEMYVSRNIYYLSMAYRVPVGSFQRLHILLSARQDFILASRRTLLPALLQHIKFMSQASPVSSTATQSSS